MALTEQEREMFAGAINVAVDLAMSENEQHKGLGQIIAALCAMVAKREPSALDTMFPATDQEH